MADEAVHNGSGVLAGDAMFSVPVPVLHALRPQEGVLAHIRRLRGVRHSLHFIGWRFHRTHAHSMRHYYCHQQVYE